MGSFLNIFATKQDLVHEVIGSGRADVDCEIWARFLGRFLDADRALSAEIAAGCPTRSATLTAIIHGGPFDPTYGFQYVNAYETICEHYGRKLSNEMFAPFRGDWLEQVDCGLAELGIDARVTELAYGGLPDPLPIEEDISYNEWSASQCATAIEQWKAVKAKQRAALDPYVLDAIKSCMGWVSAARRRSGETTKTTNCPATYRNVGRSPHRLCCTRLREMTRTDRRR